jgi:hypothetical protein
MNDTIAQFLERKLKSLSDVKIHVPTEQSRISRITEAVLRSNRLKERVSVLIDGEDVSAKILNQVRTPVPSFNEKQPVTYQSLAGMCLEVS